MAHVRSSSLHAGLQVPVTRGLAMGIGRMIMFGLHVAYRSMCVLRQALGPYGGHILHGLQVGGLLGLIATFLVQKNRDLLLGRSMSAKETQVCSFCIWDRTCTQTMQCSVVAGTLVGAAERMSCA